MHVEGHLKCVFHPRAGTFVSEQTENIYFDKMRQHRNQLSRGHQINTSQGFTASRIQTRLNSQGSLYFFSVLRVFFITNITQQDVPAGIMLPNIFMGRTYTT